MEIDDFTALVMKAAKDFNAQMQKQAYERASPLSDSAEISSAPPEPTRRLRVVEPALQVGEVDARWQQQLKQGLAVRRLDLERRRAKSR